MKNRISILITGINRIMLYAIMKTVKVNSKTKANLMMIFKKDSCRRSKLLRAKRELGSFTK